MATPVNPIPRADVDTERTVVLRLRAAGCVFAEDEARLLCGSARDPAHLEALVRRRVTGVPLEHLLGWVEFCGLRIGVEPGVFVPRRRTEFLVHRAAALLRALGGAPVPAGQAGPAAVPVVVDLCCGCGAVGAVLAAVAGPIELHAVDIDPAAVRCARRNLAAGPPEAVRGVAAGPPARGGRPEPIPPRCGPEAAPARRGGAVTPASGAGAAPREGNVAHGGEGPDGNAGPAGTTGTTGNAGSGGTAGNAENGATAGNGGTAGNAENGGTAGSGATAGSGWDGARAPRVYQGDLFAPLPGALRGRVGLLVANAPYVPTGAVGLLPPEAREHEPLVALAGGEDGLDVLRRVVAQAPRWLAPGGHLLVETGRRQAPRLVAIVERVGLRPRLATCAERGATVVIGTSGG